MKRLSGQIQDEEVRDGIRKLKKLLENPVAFEKWANETLDMSSLRKK